MIARLAVASVRHRIGSFVGTFLTAFLAIALISGGGLLLWSVLTAGPGSDRFAGADAMVGGARSIELRTATDTGDKVKVKTKDERLTGAAPLSAELVDSITGTPGVTEVVADYAFSVALDFGGRPLRAPDAATVAHGWSSAALTPYPLRNGAAPRPGEVVLQADFGVHTGQTVRLTSRTGFRELRVAGVAGGNVAGQAAVFVADSEVGELSGLTGPTAFAVRATSDGIKALRSRLGAAAIPVKLGKPQPAGPAQRAKAIAVLERISRQHPISVATVVLRPVRTAHGWVRELAAGEIGDHYERDAAPLLRQLPTNANLREMAETETRFWNSDRGNVVGRMMGAETRYSTLVSARDTWLNEFPPAERSRIAEQLGVRLRN